MTFLKCSISHPSTSSAQNRRICQLHSDPVFRKITYLHMFHSPSIFRFLPYIYGIINSFNLSLFHLTLHVKTVYLPTDTSIYMHALSRFVYNRVAQLSTSTLTHVLRYRPYIVNELYYINKYHIITSRKRLSQKNSSF